MDNSWTNYSFNTIRTSEKTVPIIGIENDKTYAENEIIVVGSSLSNNGDILINRGNKDVLIFKMR